MRRTRQNGWMIFFLAGAVGCAQSESADPQLEGNLKKHYELQKLVPVKLSAKEKRIRQERLRMQFGDVAEGDLSVRSKSK